MSAPAPSPAELPADLQQLLDQVRRRIRRYAACSGILSLALAAGLAFWITVGLDTGWFALQRLELPVSLRASLLALMLGGGLRLLQKELLGPLLRHIQDRDIALLLERRFPQFEDRLITAVESRSDRATWSAATRQLQRRATHEAEQLAADTHPDRIFNTQILRQRSWAAGLLVLSLAGLGAASPDTMPRWWAAFVRCEEVYHQRTTVLDIHVVQQPGDRRIPFRTDTGTPVYLHPRGNDLELELSVPPQQAPGGHPWVVPERIRVDVRRSDGSTSRTYVSPTGDRTFRYVLTRLQDDVEIELLAGDYRTPQPLQIRTVAPPALDQITLTCHYPEYTGWNSLRSTQVHVGGSETALPIGTTFELQATSEKPLQSARITLDELELTGNTEFSVVTLRDGRSLPRGPALLSSDGRRILLNGQIVAAASEQSATPDRELWRQQDGTLNIRPGSTLRFSLHDQDNVVSTRPLSLRIRGISDQPPVIDVRTDGIDSAITRHAVIPFTGTIRDDYGLEAAEFEFVIDDETQWRPRPFSSRPDKGVLRWPLGHTSEDSAERFQVRPLDLTEGQTLTIAIRAEDRCSLNKPNVSRSDPIVFRIVSNEELLSLLYTREINLRRRFETVIQQLQQVQEDLDFHREVALRRDAATSPSTADQTALRTCATRSGNTLRRQTNELQSILQGFDVIIRQLINNAVPPAQLSETMRQQIVRPLQEIITAELPETDRIVSRFRVAVGQKQASATLLAESAQAVQQVILRLNQVLENVRDMAEFHEVLGDLRAMQEEQKRIQQDTKRLKRQRLIDAL